MRLYTINNSYPDTNFHFTVTPTTIGGVSATHIHTISEISSLTSALNAIPNGMSAIIIDDEVYARYEEGDDDDLYAWKNSTTNVVYKTDFDKPSPGNYVYDANNRYLEDKEISKFVSAHTHVCIECFIGNDKQKVDGDVTLSSNNATLTISGSTVKINYVSPQTNNVAGILENNKNDGIGIFQLYHGDIRDMPEGIETNLLTI